MPRIEPELQRLKEIKTLPSLLKYLKEDLNWPIGSDDVEDVTFDYDPAELGFDSASTAKIDEVRQLRPLTAGQKWGIFWVKFGKKQLPVQMLRRALGNLVVKKRASTKKSDKAAWHMHDLLFISAYGDDDNRHITFAHFSESEDSEKSLPVLKVLGWDDDDTLLHLKDTYKTLVTCLNWETTPTDDPEAWREHWSKAFKLTHKEVINTTKELVVELAQLATVIKKSVLTSIKAETEKGPWRKLMLAFKKTLIKDLDEDQFADVIAQTVSYGLLTARLSSDGQISLKNLVDMVPSTNPFLKELLQHFLTSAGMKGLFDVDEAGINDVVELLNRANAQAIRNDFGKKTDGEDPVIHFYEHFLGIYNKKLKVERGVFYTPQPVVTYIVRNIHEILRRDFALEDGLADTSTWSEVQQKHNGIKIPESIKDPARTHFVQILDPATGTATFLIEVIDVIYTTMINKWSKAGMSKSEMLKAWNSYVPNHLLPRLYAFELIMAPYAIAHIKIGLKLAETGYNFQSKERARVYLCNTLESWEAESEFEVFKALALEHKAVSEVKRLNHFTVIIGNPPYLREKTKGGKEEHKRIGDWVRFGGNGSPIFDDFIKPLTQLNQGMHAKLAYELSVMFWRVSLWSVLERGAKIGVIGYISPRAYIAGPGHAGMRGWIKSHVNYLWLTDLGGDNRGARKTDNIFNIETGVSVGICVKTPTPTNTNCKVFYRDVTGSAEEKLLALKTDDDAQASKWAECPPNADTFMPPATSDYMSWPKLTDIFPWQHSGVQFKRLWPIGESPEILESRWRKLLTLPDKDKGAAYVETDARLISSGPATKQSLRFTGIAQLPTNTPPPPASRYCYRSLDRQWALLDERLADRIRPGLLSTIGPKQIFALTLMSKQLGLGPAISMTCHMPDMDAFCNRGAKDVIPLWRDSLATKPNLPLDFLDTVSQELGHQISAEEIFSYCSAILATPRYAELFSEELTTPGPRIPISKSYEVFNKAATLGTKFIWLQTFGERWVSPNPCAKPGINGDARIHNPISEAPEDYPDDYHYNPVDHTLKIGNGSLLNVRPEVYYYSQSGFKPVESWLRYRMKKRAGRAGKDTTRSSLDAVRPPKWTFTNELLELLWVIEGCVDLWPELEGVLNEVTQGPLISLDKLPKPSDSERNEPEIGEQIQLRLI